MGISPSTYYAVAKAMRAEYLRASADEAPRNPIRVRAFR
jgi:hypothetical protein